MSEIEPKYPMPALTEQEREELVDFIGDAFRSMRGEEPADKNKFANTLEKHTETALKIALAAMEAKPGLWELIESGESTFFSPHPPTDHDEVDTVWYTAPPVPVLKPIELPGRGGVESTSEKSIRDWADGWSAYREEAVKAIRAAGYEVKD